MNPEDPPTSDARKDWHARAGDEVRRHFEVPDGGLSAREARERLGKYGPNRLPPPKRRGPLVRFLAHFHDVLIYVLLGAAVVTALLGHWVDFGVILGVVLVNALIGFVQEGKAEKALDSIRAMLSLHAFVQRDGKRIEIPAEELVPGDLVLLQAGDKIPRPTCAWWPSRTCGWTRPS
jgi:Ca2+-transporting ATPase